MHSDGLLVSSEVRTHNATLHLDIYNSGISCGVDVRVVQ